MEFRVPIQIVRESTLRPNNERQFGERDLSPLSDRARIRAPSATMTDGNSDAGSA